MMTRKDYIALARALNKPIREARNLRAGQASTLLTVAVNRVAEVLANDNPRFDREKFVRACYEEDES